VEEEYLERIFNPFERLSSGGSGAPGLGLTISREIVVRHGGRMWAESEIGTGSTFLFTLPARD
jgi:signal transduction histidine kinase